MQSLTALILLGVSFDKTQAQRPLNTTDTGRTFTTLPDLTPFGIDLESTFDSLLSPAGIVDQFSLSIVIQLIFVVGYVLSGEQIFTIYNKNNFSLRINFRCPKEQDYNRTPTRTFELL